MTSHLMILYYLGKSSVRILHPLFAAGNRSDVQKAYWYSSYCFLSVQKLQAEVKYEMQINVTKQIRRVAPALMYVAATRLSILYVCLLPICRRYATVEFSSSPLPDKSAGLHPALMYVAASRPFLQRHTLSPGIKVNQAGYNRGENSCCQKYLHFSKECYSLRFVQRLNYFFQFVHYRNTFLEIFGSCTRQQISGYCN